MTIYHWMLLSAFLICCLSCLFQLLQMIFSNKSPDYASARGKLAGGILYSFSGAMSPWKKESAYLHLPTYAAGIIFHLGTLLSFVWLLLHFFSIRTNAPITFGSTIFLFISGLSGLLIFMKRILNRTMRTISVPDDYFSNLLVTGFQIFSAVALVRASLLPGLFAWATVLLLYLPLGKLRHFVYFFTSRIQLGIFYGKRGVWNINR